MRASNRERSAEFPRGLVLRPRLGALRLGWLISFPVEPNAQAVAEVTGIGGFDPDVP